RSMCDSSGAGLPPLVVKTSRFGMANGNTVVRRRPPCRAVSVHPDHAKRPQSTLLPCSMGASVAGKAQARHGRCSTFSKGHDQLLSSMRGRKAITVASGSDAGQSHTALPLVTTAPAFPQDGG